MEPDQADNLASTEFSLDPHQGVLYPVWTFILCEVILVALDLMFTFSRPIDISALYELTDLTIEGGVGTWFASIQALFIGGTVGLITWYQYRSGRSRWITGLWLLITLFFVFMSLDDASRIHERVGIVIDVILNDSGGGMSEPGSWMYWIQTFPTWYWQLFVAPFYVGFSLFMAVFFWNRYRPLGVFKFLILGFVAYFIALTLDFLDGIDNIYMDLVLWSGWTGRSIQHVSRLTEEYLEMLGTTSIWYAFLYYTAYLYEGSRIAFVESGGTDS
ncbi:MAG: hypothetical protein ABEJ65_07585 [bacterium]